MLSAYRQVRRVPGHVVIRTIELIVPDSATANRLQNLVIKFEFTIELISVYIKFIDVHQIELWILGTDTFLFSLIILSW